MKFQNTCRVNFRKSYIILKTGFENQVSFWKFTRILKFFNWEVNKNSDHRKIQRFRFNSTDFKVALLPILQMLLKLEAPEC